MAKKYSYPCPVLGNQDDYRNEAIFSFKEDLILDIDDDGVRLTIPLPKINDKEIDNLFSQKNLSLFLEIDSASSYFHEIIEVNFSESKDNKFTSFFPIGQLNKKVNYTFFIAANKGLLITPELINDLLAKDNFTFRSKENDIIAKTESDFFIVDHDFDPYSGDVSNFITVAEHPKSNAQNTELDFLGDIITVKLPKDVYKNYEKLDRSHDEMFHSSIVLGALAQALNLVLDDDENDVYSGYEWFNLINLTIDARKIDKNKDSFDIANRILGNPIHRGISYLVRSLGGED